MSTSVLTAVFAAALATAIAACGDSGAGAPPNPGDRQPPAGLDLDGELLVSAAASLTDAFAEVESAFEALHPGLDVVLNLGPSSGLREQILEGAPADVFASANPANMDAVVEAGAVAGEGAGDGDGDGDGQPRIFVTNRLQIVVPAGNPAGIAGLADFGRDELFIGLCAEGVPCGDFGREALANAGVVPAIDTDEPDVRALLTKVEAGELDAGITYVTDIASARDAVDGIAIPDAHNVVARYPIAVLAGAPNPDAAAAFVDFILSEAGQTILAAHGFGAP